MHEIEYIKFHIFIYRYKLWLSWILKNDKIWRVLGELFSFNIKKQWFLNIFI